MKLYLSRHGESEYNQKKLLGGNSGLSTRGIKYSSQLFNFINKVSIDSKLNLITSQLKRTIQTAQHFPDKKKSFKFLNEIDAGIFENKSYEFVKQNFPEEYNNRKKDKFNYVYPKGESYKMLQNRVLNVLNHLEKDSINLIICHNAVLRIIYGYFLNCPEDQIPHLDIPLHTVFYLEIDDKSISARKNESLIISKEIISFEKLL